MESLGKAFVELARIIARLRDPNGGCPWDLEQTHQSLKPYAIEETYEVLDAIDSLDGSPQSWKKFCEELGDLLLQSVLHAQLATEAKHFTLEEVVTTLTNKLVHRHPHVFGEVEAKTSAEVLKNWERSKQSALEKDKSVLDGVPQSLPALLRAQRLGEKAGRVGFDWQEIEGVKQKVFEELKEFLEAPEDKKDEELGDILFALAQWARKSGKNLEDITQQANRKFSERFRYVEKAAKQPLAELSIEKKEQLWTAAKRK